LHPSFHPGRCAEIFLDNEIIGIIGEIHPETQRAFELSDRVQVFEINLDSLFSYAQVMKHFEEIPRFPGVLLDLAIVVGEETSASELEKVIKEEGGKLLRRIDLFDVYRGGRVPEGKKSMAFSLYFRAEDRTLDLDEVKKIHNRIIGKLGEMGAELRY
jgi:phenylalanyl-tRNA synthetase beta chain